MSTLLAKKSIDALRVEATDSEHGLKRALGPITLTTLGIGAIIGAGMFVLTGAAAEFDLRSTSACSIFRS
jgi:APA family basic amino acid/polyamine antiporter